MTHSFKLARRMARFRASAIAALVVGLGACSNANSPDSSTPPETRFDTPAVDTQGVAASSLSSGIPMGIFALPTTWFGSRYSGAKQTIGPTLLQNELAAIKARGGRIVLMMAGSQSNYQDASGHFSLTKWKQRIDRFRGIDFTSYINDGTIIAHYLIDEPQDKGNWKGVPIPPSVVDEMGQYSKQLWPGLPTIVRTEPRFFSSSPHYIDAAWAQYLSRFGDVNAYLARNVAEAQARGLELVVGLNLQAGGTPNKSRMTASQVRDWGSALLGSSYPCAFISWTFDANYLDSADMQAAMDVLRASAESHSARTCTTSTTPPPPPAPGG